MSFSSIDRADAQRELTELLQRAMKSVPFVRLDKVDDVTEKFQNAVLYLENHTISPIVLDSELKNDDDDDDSKPNDGPSAYKPLPLGNKSVLERTSTTVDYSSPSLGRRSLTSKGVSEMNKLVQPKPSSRAEGSGRGLGSLRRGSEDEDADNNAGPISSSSVSTVTATTSSMNPDGTISTVSSQTTKAVTTDYSSPKLGGRSLASKKKYAPSGRAGGKDNDDEDRPRSDSDKENSSNSNAVGGGGGGGSHGGVGGGGHGGPGIGIGIGVGIHKKDAQSEQQQEEHVELAKAGLTPQMKARFKTGDLLAHTPQYKIATANQVMPEHVGSPAQLRSHVQLFQMAQDAGTTRVESPKPAFLRRLDSPETHSGKLLKKKSTLEQLVKRALAALPTMDLNEFATIKANFLEAVMLLEASTAMDTNNHQ